MTYPPQQPGPGYPPYQPPYPPPGYPGGPPPKNRTGLVVGIVAGVLVLAAAVVAVLGFWEPGFFLADEEGEQPPVTSAPQVPGGSAANPPAPAPGQAGDEAQVRQVAEQAIEAINNRDGELAKSISCDPSSAGDTSGLAPDARAEIVGEPVLAGPDKAKVPVKFTANGQTESEELEIEKRDGRWCVGN